MSTSIPFAFAPTGRPPAALTITPPGYYGECMLIAETGTPEDVAGSFAIASQGTVVCVPERRLSFAEAKELALRSVFRIEARR